MTSTARLVASLPMYDWPERHHEVDAEWRSVRDFLHSRGVDAPEALSRETGDLLDFWKRPDLFLSQTCWGPMEEGLADFVQVLGQPSYDGIEGGQGERYSSAIVMRREDVGASRNVPAPADGAALLPLDLISKRRFAFNVPDSLSGYIGIARDIAGAGAAMSIFSQAIETGGHRASIRAVADGRADVAAIDCLSWKLARQYEPPARELIVTGWTSKRRGLPFITGGATPPKIVEVLRKALRASGLAMWVLDKPDKKTFNS